MWWLRRVRGSLLSTRSAFPFVLPPPPPPPPPVLPLPSLEQVNVRRPSDGSADVVTVSRAFCVPGPYKKAAHEDLHEAGIIDHLSRIKVPGAPHDEMLFRVLAACYVAQLSGAERRECSLRMQGEDAQAKLDLLVDFARQELLAGKSHALLYDSSRQEDEASEYVEELWTKFCNDRNISVTPNERNHIYDYVMTDLVPSPPGRKPTNGDFRWRCGDNTRNTRTHHDSPVLYSGGTSVMPKFYDLTSEITFSDYFFYFPVHRLGWNMRHFASRQRSIDLQDRVETAYSLLAGIPAYKLDHTEFGYASVPLRVKELKILLEGIHNNRFLRSLTTQRPPLSAVPHHWALDFCSQHARMWVSRYDLRIYYDHDLTYAELGTQAVSEQKEEEVLKNGFSKERMPSAFEGALRSMTEDYMWDNANPIVHMRPEDYDKFHAPNSETWPFFKEHIGFPVYDLDQLNIKILRDWIESFMGNLQWETKSKGRDLFSPTMGNRQINRQLYYKISAILSF